jgi:hypothetical protein
MAARIGRSGDPRGRGFVRAQETSGRVAGGVMRPAPSASAVAGGVMSPAPSAGAVAGGVMRPAPSAGVATRTDSAPLRAGRGSLDPALRPDRRSPLFASAPSAGVATRTESALLFFPCPLIHGLRPNSNSIRAPD